MVIEAARLVWTTDDLSRCVANLDVAVFYADAHEKTVGQTRRMLTVALTEERFGQITKQGRAYSVRIPLVAPPALFQNRGLQLRGRPRRKQGCQMK